MGRRALDIFLSHSWRDNNPTDRLDAAFERAGAAVWYDREAQQDFESITRAITEGLAASRGFVASVLRMRALRGVARASTS